MTTYSCAIDGGIICNSGMEMNDAYASISTVLVWEAAVR
jgi:hypothetical protein